MNGSRLIVTVMLVLAMLISGCITIEDRPSNCSASSNSSLIVIDAGVNRTGSSQVPLGPAGSVEQPSSSKPQSISESNPSLVEDNGSASTEAAVPALASVNPLLSKPGYRPAPRPAVSYDAQEQAPIVKTPVSAAPANVSSGAADDPFSSPTSQPIVVSPSQYADQQAQPAQSGASQPQSQYAPTRTASSVVPRAASSFTSLKGLVNDPFAQKSIYVYPVKRAKEGQRISFPDLNATDLDGDILTYYFEPPLDEKGEWQTQRGDAGRYYTNISVSDGKNITVQTVILIVEPLNRPPILSAARNTIVQEGQEIRINPKVADPDNDSVIVTFSGWKDSFPYKTTYEDAGAHIVIITADDGWSTVSLPINITVKNVNRIPVMDPLKNLTVTEGDLVEISPFASDADGEKIVFRYTQPVDLDGKWQTKRGDSGTYQVTVTATDGQDFVSKAVYVRVLKIPRSSDYRLQGYHCQ